MRLALPTPPIVHVFAAAGDRQPPHGPCSCGLPLEGAVLVRTAEGGEGGGTWECVVCFAQLEAGWEEQRRSNVRAFMADGPAAVAAAGGFSPEKEREGRRSEVHAAALPAAAPCARWRVVGVVLPAACGELPADVRASLEMARAYSEAAGGRN